MPYGTPEEVASLASMWTDAGEWKDPSETYPETEPGTNPTLTEVDTWLERVSSQFNVALGTHWFVPPVDPDVSPDTYSAISQYVSSLVADLCHFKNSSGRFFTEKLVERGITPMRAVLNDIDTWICANADGLVQDHVPQRPATSNKRQTGFRVLGELKP